MSFKSKVQTLFKKGRVYRITPETFLVIQEERNTLRRLLHDTWMMIEHATKIDFSNGNVYAGVDEGNVRGWEHYQELRKKVEELGIL